MKRRIADIRRLKARLLHRLSVRWRRRAAMDAFRAQFRRLDEASGGSAPLTDPALHCGDRPPGGRGGADGQLAWRAEGLIRELYGSLTELQRQGICRPWDCVDDMFGQTRTFISNHWQVTAPCVASDFFTLHQRELIGEIFRNLVDPDWHGRFLKQLSEDTKGHPFGQDQSIAIIGDPRGGRFQFLFTGRHITLRADGGTAPGLAFGGPIVYGHAAGGRFREMPGHPGNVFWPQAIAAGRVFATLTPQQRAQAAVPSLPDEHEIGFRAAHEGVPVATFTAKQRTALWFLLRALMAPFRAEERSRILRCLQSQGGIDALKLAFATSKRMSFPEWDVWRIEGPYFVWHFQGHPHVHCWVHIADGPQDDGLNSHRGAYLFSHHDPLL